jgi:hypothetical protein
MASVQSIEVGLKMIEPSWPMLCMAISNHATRALACLEAGEIEKAIFSLRQAESAMGIGTTVAYQPYDETRWQSDSRRR